MWSIQLESVHDNFYQSKYKRKKSKVEDKKRRERMRKNKVKWGKGAGGGKKASHPWEAEVPITSQAV